MAFLAIVFYILIALVSLVIFFVQRQYTYWKRRGIPHDKPSFPYGNVKGFMTTRHLRDLLKEYYDKYKGSGPFVGIYFFISPIVLILDLDLTRDILIRDFHNFSDRGMFYNEKDDPLTGHLFALDGAKWKNLRNKLSPTFTSGKMKYMFPTVVAVAEELVETLGQTITIDPVVEVKDILARFSTDVIGTCAFGIDCNSLKDPNTEFRVVGAKVFSESRHHQLVEAFITNFPEQARKLHMRILRDDVHEFFMRLVKETVDYREKNSIKRNDFMNLLIEMKNSEEGMTIQEIAAQSFIFFFAGFETSSTTMGFALFELALNQDIQDKLRAEIVEHYEKNDGKLTYECMNEMHYMEKVVKETLRKYSVNLTLMRKSKNDYQTSDPNYIIPKGMIVFIQADAIHRDPAIYPDPEKFDPERFSPEEIQKRHPITWLPFGDGPRNCIGLRFARMQIYAGLSVLLKNFKFNYCAKTPNPLEMDMKNPILTAKGGIYLQVQRITR